MNKLPKNLLISYCGICCTLCPSFRKKQCPGCLKLPECEIGKCAKSKKQRCCFLCKEFPCKLYEEGFDWNLDKFDDLKKFKLGIVKWKPYDKEYIRLFKIGKEIDKNKKHKKAKKA